MKCSTCHHDNHTWDHYCQACGAALKQQTSKNQVGQYCGGCGKPLQNSPVPHASKPAAKSSGQSSNISWLQRHWGKLLGMIALPIVGYAVYNTTQSKMFQTVAVTGGCFQMGNLHGNHDEKPVRNICVDDFEIGKYEVTQGEWQSIMGHNPASFNKGDHYPVENVSWNDVQLFIQKMNSKFAGHYRLPTEAEWEYACRSGGKVEKYCGGDQVDSLAWYKKNSKGSTHPVGTKAANGLGIHDMSGNVWEWVEDRYQKSYDSKAPSKNPKGPTLGSQQAGNHRVNRGGSWFYGARSVRSTVRYHLEPDKHTHIVGVRVLRTYPKK